MNFELKLSASAFCVKAITVDSQLLEKNQLIRIFHYIHFRDNSDDYCTSHDYIIQVTKCDG